MTTTQSLPIKTPDQNRSDYLRVYSNYLIANGVPSPNTSKGTEIYGRAQALANQIYMAASNVPLAGDAQMPDTAQGSDLVRLAALYGLSLRPAGPSSGWLTLATTVGATQIGIPGTAQLLDPAGLRYQVSIGGQYANGTQVPIVSLDTGTATNLASGTVLRWVSPPPYVQPNATVAIPSGSGGTTGLQGGVDVETYPGLRKRLLERIQNPPNGANWPSMNATCEGSSTAVQKAFTYQAVNGPSTCTAAVVGAATATSSSRAVNSVVVSNVITPAVQAQFNQIAQFTVTTVSNYPVSIGIGLSLPASTLASPPGPGGGWIDAAPFPVIAAAGCAAVSSVTSSTVITVASDVPPVVGGTVCWISPYDFTLVVTTIASFTGAGPYTLTLVSPLVSATGTFQVVQAGDYLFPGALNTATYVAAIMTAFGAMGPGELVSSGASPSIWPRASRRPVPTQSWPSQLALAFLSNLLNAGQEIVAASFKSIWDVTLGAVNTTGIVPVPASVANPPNIWVPYRIGIYPQ